MKKLHYNHIDIRGFYTDANLARRNYSRKLETDIHDRLYSSASAGH